MGKLGQYAAVVYHYSPTSNRNRRAYRVQEWLVVYHYSPTSNRNYKSGLVFQMLVVYHYSPTSNRNHFGHVCQQA